MVSDVASEPALFDLRRTGHLWFAAFSYLESRGVHRTSRGRGEREHDVGESDRELLRA